MLVSFPVNSLLRRLSTPSEPSRRHSVGYLRSDGKSESTTRFERPRFAKVPSHLVRRSSSANALHGQKRSANDWFYSMVYCVSVSRGILSISASKPRTYGAVSTSRDAYVVWIWLSPTARVRRLGWCTQTRKSRLRREGRAERGSQRRPKAVLKAGIPHSALWRSLCSTRCMTKVCSSERGRERNVSSFVRLASIHNLPTSH